MLYSATKSVVSSVAGVAFDHGLLDVDAPVVASVGHPVLDTAQARTITWGQQLQQTSDGTVSCGASRPGWMLRAATEAMPWARDGATTTSTSTCCAWR